MGINESDVFESMTEEERCLTCIMTNMVLTGNFEGYFKVLYDPVFTMVYNAMTSKKRRFVVGMVNMAYRLRYVIWKY